MVNSGIAGRSGGAFIGKPKSGKTVFAALMFEASNRLATQMGGQIIADPGMGALRILSNTLRLLKTGEWPPGTEGGQINLMDITYNFKGILKDKKFVFNFFDLPGADVQAIVTQITEMEGDPPEQIAAALAEHETLKYMFESDTCFLTIAADDIWEDPVSGGISDFDHTSYLKAYDVYRNRVARTKGLKALFVIITKLDKIRYLYEMPDRGAPLSEWQAPLRDLIRERMPFTFGQMQAYRQNMTDKIFLIPAWIEVAGESMQPKVPLDFSDAEMQQFVEMIGTIA